MTELPNFQINGIAEGANAWRLPTRNDSFLVMF